MCIFQYIYGYNICTYKSYTKEYDNENLSKSYLSKPNPFRTSFKASK